jgi:hypothetical protein
MEKPDRTNTPVKMAAAWSFAPCSLVGINWRFRGAYSLIALMMGAVCTSETSINFYWTILRNVPEDSHLHTHRREELRLRQICLSSSACFRKWEIKMCIASCLNTVYLILIHFKNDPNSTPYMLWLFLLFCVYTVGLSLTFTWLKCQKMQNRFIYTHNVTQQRWAYVD